MGITQEVVVRGKVEVAAVEGSPESRRRLVRHHKSEFRRGSTAHHTALIAAIYIATCEPRMSAAAVFNWKYSIGAPDGVQGAPGVGH